MLVETLAVQVAGRGANGEVDLGPVALGQPDEVLLESRGRTGQEQEQPGRERIESPGVSRARARSPPGRRDDRERRRAGGLVDEDDPARMLRARRHVYA